MHNIQYLFFLICCPFTLSCAFGADKKNFKRNVNGTIWFERKLTHQGRLLSDNDLIHLQSLSNEIHFKHVLKPILVPRVVDTPSHTKVKNHIASKLKILGWTVEEDNFQDSTPHGKKTFTNIIATQDPSSTRRLVLACHYDSKLTPIGFIGATDSAVPCAMLINLATIMKSNLNAHKAKGTDLTIQFIFFDGEEAFVEWTNTDSLYGSRKLAQRLHNSEFPLGNNLRTTELHRMDLFLLLDLIGTHDTSFFSFFPNTDHWFERLESYEKRLRALGLLGTGRNIFNGRKRFHGGVLDDHIPFLEKDVPILHLISVPFPSVWHELEDHEGSLHYPLIKDMNLLMRIFISDYLSLPL